MSRLLNRFWYGPMQNRLAVNHWWGFAYKGRYIFWAWGRLNWMSRYPHTEH